jgi:hypothetical protein
MSDKPEFGKFQTADLVDGFWIVRDMTADEMVVAFPPPPELEPLTPEQELAASRAAMSLTFAQLLIGLVAEAWITEAEGEAWLTGILPSSALDLIATLPEAERFAAKARTARPSVILRNDPLVNALAEAQGKTPDDLDAFFTAYAAV